HIVGETPREVGAATEAIGLITYEARGGGSVRALAVRGGPNGIVARATAAALVLKNVQISDTGRGVLWMSPGALTVREGAITGTLWHGVSKVGRGSLAMNETLIAFAQGAGIFIEGGRPRATRAPSRACRSPTRSSAASWSTRVGSASSRPFCCTTRSPASGASTRRWCSRARRPHTTFPVVTAASATA